MPEAHPKAASTVPEHVLRIAVIQLDYTPNTESVMNKRWLPDEPLIDWNGNQYEGLSVRSGVVDDNPAAREITAAVLKQARTTRERHLELKLKQVLEFCVRQDVDIAVFPEAMVPASLVRMLVDGFRGQLAIFAGVGTLFSSDALTLRNCGFTIAEEDVGCNAAVYIDANNLELVTKRDEAATEVIKPGSGTARVRFRKGDNNRHLGLAICRDYVNAPRTFDVLQPMPDVVLVTALSRPTDEFIRRPRNFAVAFANHARMGGSTVMASPLKGFFLDPERRGTVPLPLGESIVIVDFDRFATVPSLTLEPANRLVCRAGIFYDDSVHGDPAASLSSLARELRGLALGSLNDGEYNDRLTIVEERLKGLSENGSPILLAAVQELRRKASTLTNTVDLGLFTNHLILTEVKSEPELTYEALGKLVRAWLELLDPDRVQAEELDGLGGYIDRASRVRAKTATRIRSRYRDSPEARRGIGSRRSTASPGATADGFTTFYSARLGTYGSEQAVRSLQQQLGVLRTLSAAADDSVRLVYRTSTALQTNGHLAPFFDVIGLTESTDQETLEDLREGIGQQLAAAFRGTWELTTGPVTGLLPHEHVAELRLSKDAVPKIREDWGALFDYLRMLTIPVTVQMTCRRVQDSGASSPEQGAQSDIHLPASDLMQPPELSGFFFSYERDAATFLRRADHEEVEARANMTLVVHVSSADPLPDSVLQAIGHWLFHAMPFEVVKGADAAEPLAAGGKPALGPALTPAQLLRIFHPPYGEMEARGLDRQRSRSIPLPLSALSDDGLVLGKARTEASRQDRWVDVRMDKSARLRHTYVLGPTGSGKTNLLKNLARQDIVENRGIAVIDPHGDLVDYLLKHTHGRDDDVLLLDFGDPTYLPVLNPLDLDVVTRTESNDAIERFISLLVRQSHHTFYGPRFENMVRLVLVSVMDPNFPIQPPSVLDVGTILRSDDTMGWLQSVLKDVASLSERWDTFRKQKIGNDFYQLLDWALSKFSEMEQDGTLRHVLAGGQSTVSVRRVVQNGGILLVKIPEWEMSGSAAALLGGFIQENVRRAAYERWRRATGPIDPFYMYVDEFQTFSLSGFEEIVAEARKFGLGLILAHQNLDQLEAFSVFTGASSKRLRNAVLGNVANQIVFGVSSRDAAELTKDLDVPTEVLRNPGRHRATAQVLFDLKQHSFTLEVTDADSDAGLPDQYAAIRLKMVDSGFWRRRDELSDNYEARRRKIHLEVTRWLAEQRRSNAKPALARPIASGEDRPGWRREGSTGFDHVHSWNQFLDESDRDSGTGVRSEIQIQPAESASAGAAPPAIARSADTANMPLPPDVTEGGDTDGDRD